MFLRLSYFLVLFLLYEGSASLAQSAEEETVSIQLSRELCVRIIKEESEKGEATPAPDVAYTPGVDTEGRSVAPADLEGGLRIKLPDRLVLPVEMSVRPYLKTPGQAGQNQPSAAEKVGLDKAFVGAIVVDKKGRVYFNGQPLFNKDQAELRKACHRYLMGE
jgi:hypothetical protein